MSVEASAKQIAASQGKRKEIRRIVHERCNIIIYTDEVVASGSEPTQAVVTDISTRGLGVIASTELRKGSNIIIQLHSRQFDHELRAKVIWCQDLPSCKKIIKLEPSLKWRIGLQFVVRSEEERKLLDMLALAL